MNAVSLTESLPKSVKRDSRFGYAERPVRAGGAPVSGA